MIGRIKINAQSGQVFFGEAVLLLAPLVEVHTTVIVAANAAKEGHAIFRSAIACPHNVTTSTAM